MPSTSTKLKLGYLGLAAVDSWLAGQPSKWAHRARFATKPLLMPTLASSLATNERARNSPLRTSTLAAQAGGWGGDVALLGESKKPFLAGMASFALGHAAYFAGYARHGSPEAVHTAGHPQRVAAAWVATAPVMGVMAQRREAGLGLPVFGYATALAAMVVAAGHLDDRLPKDARMLTAIGAGLFMASDTLLGFGKFVLTDPPPALESAVMASYTSAQFLLSEGAARA